MKNLSKDIEKLEEDLEKEATLITEAINDVISIANMNDYDTAIKLIRSQFVVINRIDLSEEENDTGTILTIGL
jgi:uncharacterized protein (UPF0335 family)